jgi:hypothetical protein
MIVVDIGISGGIPLGDDALDLLVPLELVGESLPLDMESLEILAVRRRVVEDPLLRSPDSLDVVLDSLESLEPFEHVVRLPGVVDVTVLAPLDEESKVVLGFVAIIILCGVVRVSISREVHQVGGRTLLSITLVTVNTVDRILDACRRGSVRSP